MSLMKTTNLYTPGSKTQIYSGALNDSWPFLSLDIKLVHVGVCSLSNPPGNAVGIRSSPPFSHLDHVLDLKLWRILLWAAEESHCVPLLSSGDILSLFHQMSIFSPASRWKYWTKQEIIWVKTLREEICIENIFCCLDDKFYRDVFFCSRIFLVSYFSWLLLMFWWRHRCWPLWALTAVIIIITITAFQIFTLE